MAGITDAPPPRRTVILVGGPHDGEEAHPRIEGPTMRISKRSDGRWHHYVQGDDPDLWIYDRSFPPFGRV